jgi:predicted RNA-binding protein with PIN domain
MRTIVDGTNVMGSRPDGWWRDRPAAQRRLAAQVAELGRSEDLDLTLVFDGAAQQMDAGGIDVQFASRRGRDAADDHIVALVESAGDPADLTVVTSDRGLTERVGALGARVETSGRFLGRLAG